MEALPAAKELPKTAMWLRREHIDQANKGKRRTGDVEGCDGDAGILACDEDRCPDGCGDAGERRAVGDADAGA